MKTITLTLALTFASMALTCAAFAADEKPEVSKKPALAGTFIARDDLPQVVKEQSAKKESKFPGLTACSKGRVLTSTWPDSVDKSKHVCADAKELYLCVSFGKVSVRCEGGK
jgi:hypothetical protein